jgi:Zn finger protein HypA/HybF involved in hydrogenase expression
MAKKVGKVLPFKPLMPAECELCGGSLENGRVNLKQKNDRTVVVCTKCGLSIVNLRGGRVERLEAVMNRAGDTTDRTGESSHPVFTDPFGPYSWCLHCETVHQTQSWEKNAHQCPKCGAGATDQWRWEDIRAANPDYPELPQEGAEYPQYGQGTRRESEAMNATEKHQ